MKKIILSILTICVSFSIIAQNINKGQNNPKKTDIKVLYVSGSSDWNGGVNDNGSIQVSMTTPDSVAERSNAFEKLLKKYFTSVTIIPGKEYKPNISANYDVTIFDGTIPSISPNKQLTNEQGRVIDYYRKAFLTEDFSYPSILIANMGEDLGRSIGTKTDWFCLCLAGEAYNTNLKHPIFKGPYKVTPTFVLKDTPKDAFHYQAFFDDKIPAQVQMWKVQTLDYINTKQFRVGMVSRPWGFTDSPEAEIISGGVSAKSPDAVAIGRHGNFFFWGFSASPKYMTEEAKVVFANAVVYTAGLKGEKVIARKYSDRIQTKENLKSLLGNSSKKAYDEYVEMMNESYQAMSKMINDIKEKQSKGEELTAEEKMYLGFPIKEDNTTYEQYLQMVMGKYYQTFGTDVDSFHKFLKENRAYFYYENDSFSIDEDVKSLGIDNTDIRLLDKAISMLENGTAEEVAKAKRILDRYTLCTFETPKEWRNWFEKNKDKIFFTQSGGWYFMVNTKDPSEPANNYDAKSLYSAAKKISLPETSDKEPIAIGASATVFNGGRQFIIVKIAIKTGYHIYGNVAPTDPYIATSIKAELPEGYTAGQTIIPAGKMFGLNGTTQYTNEAVYAIPIEGSGNKIVKINYEYQCCDPSICFPPTKGSLDVKTLF